MVGYGNVSPSEIKVKKITEYPRPTNVKSVRRFLGTAGYYRKFCQHFSCISVPLTNLLKKDKRFQWTAECQESFRKIKELLSKEPVLLAPNFNKPFTLHTDASDEGVGAALSQADENGNFRPISYFSKKLNKHQKGYSVIEKELLAVILALENYAIYVTSGTDPINVYTNHNPIVFLNKMRGKNRRLQNWFLTLQEFNLRIQHVREVDNRVADALSRVE